ncbi:putative integrase domain protein [Orientia tsutsugamushi str. Gilliam]|uniref:Integrase n=1 Tax=Orientia tsutsugamushi str. Gilliam TaxID=1359184 RepID=A0A0F3MDB7_ORITS|nr:putative integrase domain protein [Orientia tsutsugamushi str. Gilliam]SPR06174.1 integrase [Orientia tsutsugamushi str. Gilliam]
MVINISVTLFKFTQAALNKIKVPTKEEKIIQFRDIIERNLLLIISYTGFRRLYLGININGIYFTNVYGKSWRFIIWKCYSKRHD